MVQLRSQKESRHRQHPPPSFRISIARLGDEIAIDQRDEPYIDHRRVMQGHGWLDSGGTSHWTETLLMSPAVLSLSLGRWPVCESPSPFVDPASSECRHTDLEETHIDKVTELS